MFSFGSLMATRCPYVKLFTWHHSHIRCHLLLQMRQKLNPWVTASCGSDSFSWLRFSRLWLHRALRCISVSSLFPAPALTVTISDCRAPAELVKHVASLWQPATVNSCHWYKCKMEHIPISVGSIWLHLALIKNCNRSELIGKSCSETTFKLKAYLAHDFVSCVSWQSDVYSWDIQYFLSSEWGYDRQGWPVSGWFSLTTNDCPFPDACRELSRHEEKKIPPTLFCQPDLIVINPVTEIHNWPCD